MGILTRRALFALGFAAAGLGVGLGASGCGDAATMAYFLMPEQRVEAKLKHLALRKNDKKDLRVVIVPHVAALETRPEFINSHRQLGEMLGRNLKDLAAASNEKVTVVSGYKVEEFKSANPNWKQMPLPDVGRKFGADYVIYLEISHLGLYEPGSNNTLMRGRTTIGIDLVSVADPDDVPRHETYTCTYPAEAPGPVEVSPEMQPYQFREKFLSFVAHQLSHYFANYPRTDRYRME